MNAELERLLTKIDIFKQALDAENPRTTESLKSLQEYYRLDTTYSSNAMEGNTLTLSETKIAIEDGLTVGGKPLKDYYEAVGHAEAFDFMYKIALVNSFAVTEENICRLHELFYRKLDASAAGKYKTLRNYISGSEHIPTAPEHVTEEMHKLVQWAEEVGQKLHPVEYAALAHKKIVDIHPFIDGNGRTARLIMNLCLLNKGYLPVIIPPIWRLEYISALEQSRKGTSDSFVSLIGECELESYRDRFRMLDIAYPQI